MAPKRLIINLTEDQFDYLSSQKKQHGLSFAAQIRDLIRSRIEGRGLYISDTYPSQSRTREFTKVPDAQHIASVNTELKALFKARNLTVDA